MTDTDTLRAALSDARMFVELVRVRAIRERDNDQDTEAFDCLRNIDAALATLSKPEPAAVPAAWMYRSSKNVHCFAERAEDTSIFKRQRGWTETPLYASPVPSGGAALPEGFGPLSELLASEAISPPDARAVVEAGEYLITLLGKAVRNEPIRDMAEAIAAFRAALQSGATQ